jgi:transposase
MAGKRKVYTPEFKLQAVQMIAEQKRSVLKRGADAFPGSGQLTPVEEELRRLRADVKRLEMERDILKKATAFFATQTK